MSSAEPSATPTGAGQVIRLPFPMQDGERVLALFRRHWWFLWPQSILLTLIAVVPVIVAALVFDAIGVLDDMGIWFWAVAVLWLIVGVIRLFFNWYRYNHDIWVVTNQRIVDCFKAHPLNLRVATADLVNIQDMSVVKSGLTPTLLNYGTVVLETAGADRVAFLIAGVPRPESIQLMIDRERDRERGAQRGPAV